MSSVVLRWARTPSWSRTFVAAAVVWLLLGTTWALSSPLFSGPDEPAHVLRAASVAGGELLGDRREVELPGPPLVRRVEHVVSVPAGFATVDAVPACFAPFRDTADCAEPLPDLPGQSDVATTAGAYQPLFYGLVGSPLQVLPPSEGVYGARLLHVLVGALLLAAAFATGWDLGGRVFASVMALAVTPIAPYLLGVVNPSGLEIAAALVLWTATLALVLRAQPRYALMTAIALVVLAWTRPLSPVIAVGIVIAVAAAAASPSRVRALLQPRLIAPVAVGIVGIVGAVAWLSVTDAGDAYVGTPNPDLRGRTAIRVSLGLTQPRLAEMVGNLGWLDVPLPWWLVSAWGAACVVVLVLALRQGWWRDRFILVGLVAATVLLPVAAELVRGADLGLFWQSRYTLPVAAGVAVLAGWVLSRTDRLGPAVARWLVFGLAALAAVGHLIAHMVAMARYSTGPGTSPVAYLWRPGWTAPVPDVLLVLMAACASAGLAAFLVLADRPATTTRPTADPTTTSRTGH